MVSKTKILFVDDDVAIAKMQEQLLQRSGYDVVFFTKVDEALAHFKENSDRYDILITDMTMPEMTGDVFAMKIKEIRANIPIILCTGYNEKLESSDPRELGIDILLLKPVPRNDFINAIEELLDKWRD